MVEYNGMPIRVKQVNGFFPGDHEQPKEVLNVLVQALTIVFNEIVHTSEACLSLNNYEFLNFLNEPHRWEISNFPSKTVIKDDFAFYRRTKRITVQQIIKFIQLSQKQTHQEYSLEMSADENFVQDYFEVRIIMKIDQKWHFRDFCQTNFFLPPLQFFLFHSILSPYISPLLLYSSLLAHPLYFPSISFSSSLLYSLPFLLPIDLKGVNI